MKEDTTAKFDRRSCGSGCARRTSAGPPSLSSNPDRDPIPKIDSKGRLSARMKNNLLPCLYPPLRRPAGMDSRFDWRDVI
jgi:hypothetical protein